MRTVSGTLSAAQSVSGTPYIHLVFTSKDGNTTHDYASRVLAIEHHEEPYNDYAIIDLENTDLAVANITGYWTEIGYGFTTGAGDEYAATPRLWVKEQIIISAQGRLVVRLVLHGIWTVLREQLLLYGDPPYYNDPITTMTVYGILETIIETEADFLSLTLDALGDQDDGIINDFIPTFKINQVPYESFAVILIALLAMTKCYLRAEDGLAFKIIYPQTSDDADEEYYSYQVHFFEEFDNDMIIITPNHLIVYYNAILDENYNITGWPDPVPYVEEINTSQTGKYMTVKGLEQAATITNQSDAEDRAEAIAAKHEAEQFAGRLVIPHDCRVELYDYVKVYDTRGT